MNRMLNAELHHDAHVAVGSETALDMKLGICSDLSVLHCILSIEVIYPQLRLYPDDIYVLYPIYMQRL